MMHGSMDVKCKCSLGCRKLYYRFLHGKNLGKYWLRGQTPFEKWNLSKV